MQEKNAHLKRLATFLNTDFCPGANVYVYWLKEPVGWFVVALLSSILIGAFFSPIGWSIAAGLAVVLLLGLGFPWMATRILSCQLQCESEELYEGEETFLLLNVRNPLPFPVLGLVIENYFQVPTTDDSESEARKFDCGLARVPALSSAEYRLPIQPQYRGQYPNGEPVIACGFPFGIYTARKRIESIQSVLVRPRLLPLVAECEFSGSRMADAGEGNRPSHHGDFLGVREFQRGDSLRSIHWAQSARLDELVVCERGGPQKSPLRIQLSTTRCVGTDSDARENLAWRVRIAATLIDLLSARHIPFDLCIDGEQLKLPAGKAAATAAWDQLALVPLDSPELSKNTDLEQVKSGRGFAIDVIEESGKRLGDQFVSVDIELGDATQQSTSHATKCIIDLDEGIDQQLEHILQEVSRDSVAA